MPVRARFRISWSRGAGLASHRTKFLPCPTGVGFMCPIVMDAWLGAIIVAVTQVIPGVFIPETINKTLADLIIFDALLAAFNICRSCIVCNPDFWMWIASCFCHKSNNDNYDHPILAILHVAVEYLGLGMAFEWDLVYLYIAGRTQISWWVSTRLVTTWENE